MEGVRKESWDINHYSNYLIFHLKCFRIKPIKYPPIRVYRWRPAMTLSTWIHAVFRRVRVSPSKENEILIFKPRHDTISVISIESTVGRRTRDGWNINADISLLCGSLTTPAPLPHLRHRADGGFQGCGFRGTILHSTIPVAIYSNRTEFTANTRFPGFFALYVAFFFFSRLGHAKYPPSARRSLIEGAPWIPDAGSGYV